MYATLFGIALLVGTAAGISVFIDYETYDSRVEKLKAKYPENHPDRIK